MVATEVALVQRTSVTTAALAGCSQKHYDIAVSAVNGVLARAHRPQRGAPECGVVHTVLPHAIRGRGPAVPCSLLRQVTHQSLRTPRVSPHIGRRGQWPWCAGAGFCVGVGVRVGAALVGFTVLVGGAGCAAGVLGDGWMRVAGAWVSAGVFGVGARLVGGAGPDS